MAAGAVNAFLAPRLAVAGAEPWVLQGLMVVAGGVEGALLGIAQWLALRRLLPGIGAGAWTAATALGAATGWLVGSLASAFEPAAASRVELLVLVGAVTGIVLGLALGLAQALVLWKHAAKTGAWVLLNAVAWMLGMIVSILGARALPPGDYGLEALWIGLATGAGVGITVGAVTGIETRRWPRTAARRNGRNGDTLPLPNPPKSKRF